MQFICACHLFAAVRQWLGCARVFYRLAQGFWTLPLDYRYFAVDEVTVTSRPQNSPQTGFKASAATLCLTAGF